MIRDEFVNNYTEIVRRALEYAEKARREGLLALDEELDQEKIDARDIFDYGLRFVVDGVDREFIEKILTNLIKQEKDEDMILLKNIQKEAVLMIQEGLNPRLLYAILNSYVDIPLKEDEIQKKFEE
jgi:flagellar motor component MotA